MKKRIKKRRLRPKHAFPFHLRVNLIYAPREDLLMHLPSSGRSNRNRRGQRANAEQARLREKLA